MPLVDITLYVTIAYDERVRRSYVRVAGNGTPLLTIEAPSSSPVWSDERVLREAVGAAVINAAEAQPVRR